ncbi:MAG: sodium:solute symporter family protein [Archaeoglobaceae archaeon]
MNEFIAALVAYVVLGSLIAAYARGARSQEEFFIAGRNVSGLISALTYAATTYSAFMMVGLVGMTYATGVGAAGFELMYLVGTLFLLSYYAPKIWRLGRERGIVSPTEFLALRYGETTAKLAALIALIALIPYTSAQMIGVALLLENAGLSFASGVAVAAILVALWAFVGGLRGVALTDAFQGIVMLSAAVLVVAYVTSLTDFSKLPELGEHLYVPNSFWSYERFAALVTPWFFFALTNPQVFQRLFIPRDERALKRMVVYFGLFGLVYTFLVTMLGLELRLMTESGEFPVVRDRDRVTPTLLSLAPSWLAALVSLSILMAAVTTANSIVLSLSSMVSRDIVGEKGVTIGRLSVVVLTTLVALFALQRPQYIVELSVTSSTILLCQLPLIIGYFHWDRGGRITGISTLIAGFTAAIVYPRLIPLSSVATLLTAFAVYAIVAVLESRK